jgi:6-phosphogluconolactonase (cycloisomerase 2 family)
MPLVTRFSNQGNLFKESTEPNWTDGDLWSDTTDESLKINVNGTAENVGQTTETHTFTTAETWNPETQTGFLTVTIDGTDLTGGSVVVKVDGSTSETVSSGVKSRLVNPSTSLSLVSISEAYNLSAASYDSKSFSVNAQEGVPSSVAISADGTKMYAAGGANSTVFQYTLSTAFDISTASYASKSFSLTSQESNVGSITFKPDGTKMYIVGSGNDTVYQYTLSTAWDISTASYASKSLSVNAQSSNPRGISFKPDGTKMYIVGLISDSVFQYTLSTAWDMATASYASKTISVSSQDTNPQGIAMKSDGTEMYIVGSTNDKIYQYTLSTVWDISTASYDSVFLSVASQDTLPTDLTIGNEGTKIYLMGGGNDIVYQYSFGSGFAGSALATVL